MPTAVEPRSSNPAVLTDVLKAVASADGKAWFPADFAARSGTPRTELTGPLNDLRMAGLIEVVDWVRGRGQGYALTAEGRKALHLSGPVTLDAPKLRAIETNPGRMTPFERGEQARAALFSPRPALVTPVVVVVIALWFLTGLGLAMRDKTGSADYLRGSNLPALLKLGAVTGRDLIRGEWWRLGTCVFVHIGLLHFAVNVFALVAVGPVAEGLWGRWRFLLVFFGGGIAGATVAMAVRPDAVLAGASGAVWGVLASVVAWLALFARHFPPDLVAELARRLGLSLAVNALISFAPGVSWEAHLGGGVAGFVIAVLSHLLRPGTGWRSLAAAAGLIFLPLLGAAGLKRAMDKSETWAPIRFFEEQRKQLAQARALSVTAEIRYPAYPQVKALFDESTAAVLRDLPEQKAAVRARAERVKAEAGAVRATLAMFVPGTDAELVTRNKATAYLDAVVKLMTTLDELLAPDHKPDPAMMAERGKQKEAVEAAWKAIEGK
jgi:membrane associated rhomboid family serine protease